MGSRTTEEAREYMRAWRAKNPEKYRAYNKKYREENADRYKSLIGAWRELNHGKIKGYHLKSTYGISAEQKTALLVAQGGCCGICKSEDPGSKLGWQVDADHSEKPARVRGILCVACNTSIGKLKHNSEILRRAADWVEGANAENVARIIKR